MLNILLSCQIIPFSHLFHSTERSLLSMWFGIFRRQAAKALSKFGCLQSGCTDFLLEKLDKDWKSLRRADERGMDFHYCVIVCAFPDLGLPCTFFFDRNKIMRFRFYRYLKTLGINIRRHCR